MYCAILVLHGKYKWDTSPTYSAMPEVLAHLLAMAALKLSRIEYASSSSSGSSTEKSYLLGGPQYMHG